MGQELKIMRESMQKVLLATTALVASTGFAMADVDLSGSAEMGIFGGEEVVDGEVQNVDAQFHTDIDVNFSLSGETDGGLTFGASVDLDESIGDNNADDGGGESAATRDDSRQGGETIFVSGAFGTLTMGDTDGAFDFALQEALIGSALRDDHEHVGYSGNGGLDGTYDGQVVRYDYEFGSFAVAVSAEIDDDQDDFGDNDEEDVIDEARNELRELDNDTVLGIGFRYNGEFAGVSFGAGIGYQRAGMTELVDTDEDGLLDDGEDMDAEAIGVSLDFALDQGIEVILNYSEFDDLDEDSHYGIAVGYEFGAFLVAANYGEFDLSDGGEDTGYGLIANYDLGGGASLQAGYGFNDPEDSDSFDTFSFGISMSF